MSAAAPPFAPATSTIRVRLTSCEGASSAFSRRWAAVGAQRHILKVWLSSPTVGGEVIFQIAELNPAWRKLTAWGTAVRSGLDTSEASIVAKYAASEC
jgi:hypothetical protein